MKQTRIAVVTYDDQEAVLIQIIQISKNIYFSKVIKLSYRQKSNGSIFFHCILYNGVFFVCLFVFCFLSWTLNKITKISVNRICLPQEIFLVLYQVLACLIRKLIQNRGIYLLVAISGELKRDTTVHSFILMVWYFDGLQNSQPYIG